MASLFFGLSIARRGMMAQQSAVNTANHNVANANTPGYSRQRAVMETTTPWPVPSVNMATGAGQVGTGVEVALIERVRDTFLDRRIRNELQSLGSWEQRCDVLEQVEVVFNEPGDTGLATLFGEFWNSWQDLSKFPESPPQRTTVIETATSLAEVLRHTYTQLTTVRDDTDDLVALKVDYVNNLLRQIADLNEQIVNIKASDLTPNDLLDRRDLLLDELGKITAIETEPVIGTRGGEPYDTGAVRVKLANRDTVVLVDWDDGIRASVVNNLAVDGTSGVYEVTCGADILRRDDLGGELQGIMTARDVFLPEYIDGLDTLAVSLAGEVNLIHQDGRGLDGTTGLAFFVDAGGGAVDGAAELYVNQTLIEDETKLAAAANGSGVPSAGDGANALALAQLRQQGVAGLGGVTVDDYYANLIARLGVATQQSQRMVENQNVLVADLNKRKEEISGVSLDEEVVNIVQYQYAYQAAAKVISVIDGLLDTLINKMAP